MTTTLTQTKTKLEEYFDSFRKNILGIDQTFESPYGEQPLVYADWIASGRLYRPIEEKLLEQFGPMVGNTHSEASETGCTMTQAYHLAHAIIKKHVHANADDVILTTGFGMTSGLAKLQRILGLKIPEKLMKFCDIPREERPVVFLTHMEHHSNQTPWLESLADVVVLEPDENLMVNPQYLRTGLQKYADRKVKIGSFSACSNVSGVITPFYELAQIMHEYDGYCFVDFAASAPYVDIDMHPKNEMQRLDAIFFSPHKFLGGPGSSGVLIFNKKLYKNRIPDHPGGGTVKWTNPWGEHTYVDDIEIREDGGTPGFMQAIRAAMCVRLKEQMGIDKIKGRETELLKRAFKGFSKIDGVFILAQEARERLGVISFYVEGIHHNMVVRLLNDRFGIQVRGGCSCAGTYGHYLLHVDREMSHRITEKINSGDLSEKPGWVRLSLHPTMTNAELDYIMDSLEKVVANAHLWKEDYIYNRHTGEFDHKDGNGKCDIISRWFDLEI